MSIKNYARALEALHESTDRDLEAEKARLAPDGALLRFLKARKLWVRDRLARAARVAADRA